MIFSFLIVDPGTAILAGAGVSALSSLFGSLFGSSSSQDVASTNLRAVRETNAANRRLAEYQNAESLRRWEMENEYNTPSAQMERYKAAGLNPYIMQASGAQNVSANMPAVQRAQMQAYQQTENPGAYIASGMQNIGAQIQQSTMSYYNAEAQKAQIIKTLAEAQGQETLNKAQKDYLAMQMKSTIDKINSDIDLQRATIEEIKVRKDFTSLMRDHERFKIFNTIEDTANKGKLGELTVQQLANAITENKLLNQNISLSRTQQRLVAEQVISQSIDNMWRKMGLNPNDSSLTNLAVRYVLNPNAFKDIDLGKNMSTIMEQIAKSFKSGFEELSKQAPGKKNISIYQKVPYHAVQAVKSYIKGFGQGVYDALSPYPLYNKNYE